MLIKDQWVLSLFWVSSFSLSPSHLLVSTWILFFSFTVFIYLFVLSMKWDSLLIFNFFQIWLRYRWVWSIRSSCQYNHYMGSHAWKWCNIWCKFFSIIFYFNDLLSYILFYIISLICAFFVFFDCWDLREREPLFRFRQQKV